MTVQYIAIPSNTFPLHANNFKQNNHNITIMSLNILAYFILRTGKSSEGQFSVSFQNLSVWWACQYKLFEMLGKSDWQAILNQKKTELKGTFFKLKTVCWFKLCVVLSNWQIKKLEFNFETKQKTWLRSKGNFFNKSLNLSCWQENVVKLHTGIVLYTQNKVKQHLLSIDQKSQ